MKIEDCTLDELNMLGGTIKYGKYKLEALVEQFVASNKDAVKIVLSPGEYKNPHSFQAATKRAIDRRNYTDRCMCSVRGGKAFLVRLDKGG